MISAQRRSADKLKKPALMCSRWLNYFKWSFYGSVEKLMFGACVGAVTENDVPGAIIVLKNPPFCKKKEFPLVPPIASILCWAL